MGFTCAICDCGCSWIDAVEGVSPPVCCGCHFNKTRVIGNKEYAIRMIEEIAEEWNLEVTIEEK